MLLLLVGFGANAIGALLGSRVVADCSLLVAFFASLALASLTFWRNAWLLVLCAFLVGLASEAVGLRCGVPFGEYEYAELGPTVLGVPVPVALAWGMYLYACYMASSGITHDFWRRSLLASILMVVLDMAVDPVMVELRVWTWHTHGPGWFGIPLSNFVGWFVVSMASSLAYRLLTRDRGPSDVQALRYAPLAYLMAFLPLILIAGPRSLLPSLAALGLAVCLLSILWVWKSLERSEGQEWCSGLRSALHPHESAPHRVIIAL